MNIAYVSPLQPLKSGISDYSEELLPELKEFAEIDLYVDGYRPTSPLLNRDFRVFDISELKQRYPHYDFAIYHIGNHYGHHNSIYEYANELPGIVVLHDFSLHNLMAARLIACAQDPTGYVNEMQRWYGDQGYKVARDILDGKRVPVWETTESINYPLNHTILEVSRGLVVHSAFARERLEKNNAVTPIAKVMLPARTLFLPKPAQIRALRRKYKIKPETFILGAFGYVTRTKRIDKILSALRKVVADGNENIVFMIVGHREEGYDIKGLIRESGLSKYVLNVGSVELADFEDHIRLCNVCLNLRYPTQGESSASLLRVMGMGKPVIVTDVGSFSEIPDEIVRKVRHDASEVDDIAVAIVTLFKNPKAREIMGKRAHQFVKDNCTYRKTAKDLITFLSRIQNGQVYKERLELSRHLFRQIGTELKGLDPTMGLNTVRGIASKIESLI